MFEGLPTIPQLRILTKAKFEEIKKLKGVCYNAAMNVAPFQIFGRKWNKEVSNTDEVRIIPDPHSAVCALNDFTESLKQEYEHPSIPDGLFETLLTGSPDKATILLGQKLERMHPNVQLFRQLGLLNKDILDFETSGVEDRYEHYYFAE
eukprot:GHVN01025758.1.p1 GENE.GHVN01025758.1~~GHVN01025758.1.p1  ORF type:complete len:172 (-),score=2.55 GHVN01025758.1:303-749(-)